MTSDAPAARPGRPEADPGANTDRLEAAVQDLTQVLLAVARGDSGVRAERTYGGDAIDVLAFLVNSTADEVGELMRALKAEQEELQRTRDQLVLNAKLAALGKLAAGVAHELNQPLTVVQLMLDVVRTRPDDRVGDHEADFVILAEAARRMGRIIDGIRTFGRSGTLQIVPVPAERPLLGALELLGESFERQHIVVERRVGDGLPQISADADRLHQVFVNLLLNARDALMDSRAGTDLRVTVEVRGDQTGVTYVVADNGPGIAPDIVPRIFDLFFTTKEVGQGTGLGLSVSHGIVADHGGRLYHEAAPGGGARFVVELPLDGRAADERNR